MTKLLARSPCDGLLPLTIGTCTLEERAPVAITSIAPARGKERTVSGALKKNHGAAFPAPNRATGKDSARCIWFGSGQAMLVGAACGALSDAATTDQSDACPS